MQATLLSQHTQPPATPNNADHLRAEERKRQQVFVKAPRTILIKILAMGYINEVPKVGRNDADVEAKHTFEADTRHLDPRAIRAERTDTGYPLFQKEPGVRVKTLLDNLRIAGYQLVGFHWQQQNNKGPVNTFEFSKEGQEIRMPDTARKILSRHRFNHVSVWCNLRFGGDGKQYRLDTVNIAAGRITEEPARNLVMDGNTYRLV